MNVPELSRGSRKLGWTSCLTSAGRVNRTTFLHINALARLTGTTLDPEIAGWTANGHFSRNRPARSSWIAFVVQFSGIVYPQLLGKQLL